MGTPKDLLKRHFFGRLLRVADDAHQYVFTKKEILCFADNDEESAEEVLQDWEARSGAKLLADIRAASLEDIVVSISLSRLWQISEEDHGKQTEVLKHLEKQDRSE